MSRKSHDEQVPFEPMSKRRRGLSLRVAGEAWPAQRARRRNGADREAGQQRPLPLRIGSALQELLPLERPLLTAMGDYYYRER